MTPVKQQQSLSGKSGRPAVGAKVSQKTLRLLMGRLSPRWVESSNIFIAERFTRLFAE